MLLTRKSVPRSSRQPDLSLIHISEPTRQHQRHQQRDEVYGQKLETVASFKYLGSVVSDEGSKPEILSRIAQMTAALTRLKPLWNDRNISLNSKIYD